MIYGILSDIHANLEALEAVLAELRECDAFVCLGDVVGYGADPGACIERLRNLPGIICIAGNHDLAAVDPRGREWFNPFARAAIDWTAEQLTDGEKAYLTSLPLSVHVEGAVLVHGSLPDEMAYLTTPQEARVCFNAMSKDLAFVGHTHVAEYYRTSDEGQVPEQISLWSGGPVDLETGVRYIVNPGAIGQPRDSNPLASFATWDSERNRVEVKRVGYDTARTQEKMERAGLPDYLIERLAVGR